MIEEFFENTPINWNVKKIEDMTSIKTGGTPSTKVKEYWENGTIPWMVSGDIHKGVIKNISKRITKLGVQNSAAKLLPIGSVIVALNGQGVTKGMVAYLEIETTCNQSLAAIIPNKIFFNPKYLYFNLQNRYKEIRGLADLNARTGLNLELLRKIKVILPQLEEQSKIASILSTVDDLIKNTDHLINSYTLLKKELMQTLLTKGIGHKKFKKTEIGTIPEEWKIKKLEEISIKMQSGGTPLSTVKDYYNGDIPFVKVEDITNSRKYLIKTNTKITASGLKNSSAWIVPINSILYSMYASVGFLSINKVEVATNQAIINIIINNKIAQTEYIYYQLLFMKNRILKYIDQTTQKNLNAGKVRKFIIPIPRIEEQEKIIVILSSVDNYIDLCRTKKENLQVLKKGLMQQLLTGKIRVKV
jgi:type I restriction enzyme, S subunit